MAENPSTITDNNLSPVQTPEAEETPGEEVNSSSTLETPLETPFETTVKGEHLSSIGQNLTEIPSLFGDTYGDKVKQLDFSYNGIRKVTNLQNFKTLNSLVLDNNELDSSQNFPSIPTLQTLWVNNNKIDDLRTFMDCVVKSFPNLTYLSMLKNPACPNYFTGKDFDDYQRYRYYVLYRMNKLKFLDSSPVNSDERKQAMKVGPYAAISRPDESLYSKKVENGHLEQFPSLPDSTSIEGKVGSARIGVSTTVYLGVNSEGNRFILNEHL